jgi:hypothetical protein
MKSLLLILILLTAIGRENLKNDTISSKYSCLVNTMDGGRCTGSAYCTACRNCSRCAHCSNGGSCGVCGGGSSNYSRPKKTKQSSPSYEPLKTSRTYKENELIIIYNEVINLRKGPGLKYEIIEKLLLGDSVTIVKKDGEWLKVSVDKTGSVGYVYIKLLKL